MPSKRNAPAAVEPAPPTVLAVPVKERKPWLPTRKWGVAQFVAFGALATMYVTTGSWDQEESIYLIGWIVQAGSTYLVANAPDNTNSP
jgi:hypothetical protein